MLDPFIIDQLRRRREEEQRRRQPQPLELPQLIPTAPVEPAPDTPTEERGVWVIELL